MKIFISWSGSRSKAVAELFNGWIRRVLQACRPWISTEGIERGAIWFNEIKDQLGESAHGVVMLTQENKVAPWIMFEAGALARGLSTSRVLTFLIDLEPKDVEGPLTQFNHTGTNRESMFQLVKTLNNHLGDYALSEGDLALVFESNWLHFQTKLEQIIESTKMKVVEPSRTTDELLAEILENTRQLRIGAQIQAEKQIATFPSTYDMVKFIHRGKSYDESLAELRASYFAKELHDAVTADCAAGIPLETAVRQRFSPSVPGDQVDRTVAIFRRNFEKDSPNETQ